MWENNTCETDCFKLMFSELLYRYIFLYIIINYIFYHCPLLCLLPDQNNRAEWDFHCFADCICKFFFKEISNKCLFPETILAHSSKATEWLAANRATWKETNTADRKSTVFSLPSLVSQAGVRWLLVYFFLLFSDMPVYIRALTWACSPNRASCWRPPGTAWRPCEQFTSCPL